MRPAEASRQEPSDEEPPVSILLVDDRKENLLALEAILGGPGLRLVTATSGQEALGLVLRQEFAAILLDVFMPEMDGFEVAGHLKQLERTRHVPLLFLTASATEVEHIYRAYSVGAVDYLIKPLDGDVVRKKVEVFVDLYRQRQKIERQAELLVERERREHALRLAELRVASDRRYRKLVEGIDHVMGWSAEPDTLRLTFVSRQAEQILGYSLEQLSAPDFWIEHVHPEDRDLLRSAVERAVREGSDQDCNHRVLGAGDRVLWLHTGVSVTPALEGQPAEVHGVSVDVTGLKRAEQDQRLLAAASGLLGESLDDPEAPARLAGLLVPQVADCCLVDTVTASGEIERIASAHADPATGALASAAAQPGGEFVATSSWPARVLRSGRPELHPEVQAPHAGLDPCIGPLGTVSCILVPLSAAGRVLGVMTLASSASRRRLDEADLALAQDLGQRAAMALESARLYRQARAATRAREDLLAIVSHDLRNPLAAIMSGAEILTMPANGDPTASRKVAATILRAATSMAHLVDDLLEAERIERRRVQLERSRVSPASLVHDSVELLEPVARRAAITLRVEADGAAATRVLCDREAILRVFSNLIGNAIKFSARGGEITIGAEPRGTHVQFSVADRGPGIPAEQLEHMFDGRARPAKDGQRGTGLGLGLVIARGIVEAHDGQIWAESRVGAGSCFRFTIPVIELPGEQAGEASDLIGA